MKNYFLGGGGCDIYMQKEGRRYSHYTHLCLSATGSIEKIRVGSRGASFTPEDI